MILERVRAKVGIRVSVLQSLRGWRLGIHLVPGILVGLLLYVALRGARLDAIWHLVMQLHARQLLPIVALDAAVFLIFGLRWWMVARVHVAGIRLTDALLVRLAAFGISYFTPGPQFGGEALQAVHLNRQHGATLPHSTAAVAIDKLIELLGNYFFLIAGVVAAIGAGLIPHASSVMIFGVLLIAALAAWPLAHLLLLRANVHPLSVALSRVSRTRGTRSRFVRSIRVSERLMGRFCRRRPGRLIALLALSLCASGLAVAEYALVISAFSVVLSAGETLSAWTAAWLSFLIPVPGGLGSLEAIQVAALGQFGVAAEAAIGASLLMRARDIVMGGTGMLLAALRWQSWTSKRRQIGVF